MIDNELASAQNCHSGAAMPERPGIGNGIQSGRSRAPYPSPNSGYLTAATLSGAAGYTEAGLAADLGLAGGDPAMADAAAAYLDAARASFWHEAERLARSHLHPG